MIILEILFAFFIAILMRIIMTDVNDETKKVSAEPEAVKILVESINGSYYAWTYENSEFITQSEDKESFIEELKKKFPNQNLNLLSKEKIQWHKKSKSKA